MWSLGKSEEESNTTALTPVRKNMDQNQNEGAKKESNVLATREAKESIVQLGWAIHIGDSNTENTITQSKARRARGIEELGRV